MWILPSSWLSRVFPSPERRQKYIHGSRPAGSGRIRPEIRGNPIQVMGRNYSGDPFKIRNQWLNSHKNKHKKKLCSFAIGSNFVAARQYSFTIGSYFLAAELSATFLRIMKGILIRRSLFPADLELKCRQYGDGPPADILIQNRPEKVTSNIKFLLKSLKKWPRARRPQNSYLWETTQFLLRSFFCQLSNCFL